MKVTEKKEFYRNCPSCNVELKYTNYFGWRYATRTNVICFWCSVGKKRTKEGDRFGRLTLKEPIRSNLYKRRDRWLCLCDCGNLCEVSLSNLKNGNTKSCGCLSIEMNIERSTKHGFRKRGKPHYLASLQIRIKSVCNNPNNHKYMNYGGRGIDYDPRFNDCKTFIELILEHLGERPTENHSMDRKDNDKGYWLDNMQWALPKVQSNNRRKQKPPNTHINHRKLYVEFYNVNIKGFDIHHINGEHFDNRPENLIHVTRKQHGWLESPSQNYLKLKTREEIIEILKQNNI
jgi:hypothetical protein